MLQNVHSMKSITLFFLLFLISASVLSQTKDQESINVNNKRIQHKIKENSYSSEPMLYNSENRWINNKQSIGFQSDSEKELDESRSTILLKELPSKYLDYTSLNRANPYANDYKHSTKIKISEKSHVHTSNSYETHVLVGAISLVNATYSYSFNENIDVSVGSYIAKYNFGLKTYNDAGINASLKFDLSNRISIIGFGQYSGFSQRNNFNFVDNWEMVPTTNFGGALEYKISDRLGVMGGVSRELNPMTGKWKNIPFIVPIFYEKK